MKRPRLAKRRKAMGYTQEQLAERLGVERETVGRWERGQSDPQPWVRARLAKLLDVSLDQLDELLSATASGPAPESGHGVQVVAGVSRGRRARTTPSEDGDPAEAVQAFRLADRQVGGGYLYAAVQQYLTTRIGPLLGSAMSETSVFIAAAGWTEMAGWMALDAGWEHTADRHFHRALQLARVGCADLVAAQVMASRSHLALSQERVEQAEAHAEQGWQMLTGGEDTALRARLLVMRARAAAQRGHSRQCRDLLHHAESVVSVAVPRSESAWTSPFDEATFASEAARCLYDLHDYAAAITYAERALHLRPPDRLRARALARLLLAQARIARGEADHACAEMQQVSSLAGTLGSRVVTRSFADSIRMLLPFTTSPTVRETLPVLQSNAAQHTQVLHWLGGEAP